MKCLNFAREVLDKKKESVKFHTFGPHPFGQRKKNCENDPNHPPPSLKFNTFFYWKTPLDFFYIEVFYKKYIMTFILGWDVSMEQINDSANPSFEKLKFYPTKHKPLFSVVCTVKTLWLASKVNFCKYFTIWFVLSHLF